MPEAHIENLINITSITFGMGLFLSVLLLFVHFFTRHIKNMVHRLSIFCAVIGIVGIIWHGLSPLLHKRYVLAHGYISGMIWVVFLFSAAFLTNRIVDRYLWNKIYIQNGEVLATSFVKSAVSSLIYLLFIIITLGMVFQKEIHALATFATGYSLILAYSGSEVIKEIFAGIALNINPAFKKGDFLKLEHHQAKVVDINWRYVVLEDIDANLIYVPNTDMIHHAIYNYSGSVNPTRVIFSFHTHPNVPPQSVIDLVTPKLKQLPYLSQADWFEDNVAVHIKDCNAHSMEFEVRLLVEKFDYYYQSRTTAYKSIWYTLSNHNIPLYSYNMRVDYDKDDYNSMSNLWHQAMPQDQIEKLFKKTPVFQDCTAAEIKLLAKHAKIHEFVPTQHLFSVGDDANSLFVIAKGTVRLTKPSAIKGEFLMIKDIQPGQAVGVNAMVDGGKRERHAIALDSVMTYEIDQKILAPIFKKHPDKIRYLADEIIHEEMAKEKEFEKYIKKRTAEQEKRRNTLIGQIREFLGVEDASDL